jgi:hypothetical protein
LKEGERRGGPWEATFGIEQVEIDALATLRPDVLRGIVEAGIRPFSDRSLERRVREARQEWVARAQPQLEAQLGEDVVAALREAVEQEIVEAEELVNQINERLWLPTDDVELPPVPEIPPAKLNGVPSPLASSDMGHVELVDALNERRAYAKGGR